MVTSINFASTEDRNLYIVQQRQAKVSVADISKILKISKRSIERVYSTYRRIKRRKGSGRKKALTRGMKRSILNKVNKTPSTTCKSIANSLDNAVSDETVCRYLHEQNIS